MTQIPKHGTQGAARPPDLSGEYNRLLFTMRQVLSKVNTAALVEVMAVYGGGIGSPPTVDVQPLVNQVDGYGNAIPSGILYSVPAYRMQSGVNAIICDPQVGDIGACIFCDRDISTVKKTKAQANPSSRRRFSVSDGMYFGGVLNGTPANYIQFLNNKILISHSSLVDIESPQIDLSSWAGMISAFGMGTVPAGWLACPTSQTLVSTTTYARLFAALGYVWGGSGGNFGLPYLASGYVPVQGTVGVLTHGTVKDHTHKILQGSGNYSGGGDTPILSGTGTGTTGLPYTPEGGPDNLAAGMGVMLCVKY